MVVFSLSEWSTGIKYIGTLYTDPQYHILYIQDNLGLCCFQCQWQQLQVLVCTQWHRCVTYIIISVLILNGQLHEIALVKVHKEVLRWWIFCSLMELLSNILMNRSQYCWCLYLTHSFSISYLANLQWLVYIWSHSMCDCEEPVCEQNNFAVIQSNVAWLDVEDISKQHTVNVAMYRPTVTIYTKHAKNTFINAWH